MPLKAQNLPMVRGPRRHKGDREASKLKPASHGERSTTNKGDRAAWRRPKIAITVGAVQSTKATVHQFFFESVGFIGVLPTSVAIYVAGVIPFTQSEHASYADLRCVSRKVV